MIVDWLSDGQETTVRDRRYREEMKKERGRCEIGRGEEHFVEQRAVGNGAETSEEQLGARWVDRAEVAMIDLVPGRKFRPHWFELGIVRRGYVGIKAGALDFSFP